MTNQERAREILKNLKNRKGTPGENQISLRDKVLLKEIAESGLILTEKQSYEIAQKFYGYCYVQQDDSLAIGAKAIPLIFNECLKVLERENKPLPTYNELMEALKDTHNLYIQAVKNNYLTHDITRVMGNENIFKKIESK